MVAVKDVEGSPAPEMAEMILRMVKSGGEGVYSTVKIGFVKDVKGLVTITPGSSALRAPMTFSGQRLQDTQSVN